MQGKHLYCSRSYPCNPAMPLMLRHKDYHRELNQCRIWHECLCLLDELGTNMTTLYDTN